MDSTESASSTSAIANEERLHRLEMLVEEIQAENGRKEAELQLERSKNKKTRNKVKKVKKHIRKLHPHENIYWKVPKMGGLLTGMAAMMIVAIIRYFLYTTNTDTTLLPFDILPANDLGYCQQIGDILIRDRIPQESKDKVVNMSLPPEVIIKLGKGADLFDEAVRRVPALVGKNLLRLHTHSEVNYFTKDTFDLVGYVKFQHRMNDSILYGEVSLRNDSDFTRLGYNLVVSFLASKKCFQLPRKHPQETHMEYLRAPEGEDKLYKIGVKIKQFPEEVDFFVGLSSPGQPINPRTLKEIILKPYRPGTQVATIQQFRADLLKDFNCVKYPHGMNREACRDACYQEEMLKNSVLYGQGFYTGNEKRIREVSDEGEHLINDRRKQDIFKYCQEIKCPQRSCKNLDWELTVSESKLQEFEEGLEIQVQIPAKGYTSTSSRQYDLWSFFLDLCSSGSTTFGISWDTILTWLAIVVVWLIEKKRGVPVGPEGSDSEEEEED